MINLIPPYARKQVKIEYWIRVVSVWLIFFALACLIISLLLVPSLVLIRAQFSAYGGEYQNANEKNDMYDALEQDVRDANAVAAKLVGTNNSQSFSKLLFELQEAAKNKVTLNSVSFSRVEGQVESINITGNSISRASLVSFRDTLEVNALFESAKLPLSNLAKDKDVPFSITIVTSNEINE